MRSTGSARGGSWRPLQVVVAMLLLCLPWLPSAAAQTRQLSVVASPPEPPYLRIDAEFHTQVVNRVAQDPTGRIIVTASDDKTLRIWKADDGTALATLRVPIADGDEGALYAVAIAPDGKTLIAGGYTGATWDRAFAVYLFDLETQRLRGRLPNLPAPINHIAYAPDGHAFALALGGTAGIRLIDAHTGALIAADDHYRGRTTWVDFDQRGHLLSASFDGEIRLYDANGRLLAHRIPVANTRPYSVQFSPDGGSIAVGYADQPRVELLSALDLKPKTSLVVRPEQAGGRAGGGLGAVAWSADGGLYAGGSLRRSDGLTLVRFWPVGPNAHPIDLPGLRDTIFQLATTQDGGLLMVGADPALVKLDRNHRVVFRKQSPGLDFRDMGSDRFQVSADGLSVQLQTMAMASPWLVDLGRRSVTPVAGTRGLKPVMEPTGPRLQVTQWRNAPSPSIDGQPIRLEPEELSRSFAVTPAQDRVVIGTDYQLRAYDRRGQQTDAVAMPSAVWSVGISGDGHTVVAATGDGTLRWFGLSPDGRLDPRVTLFLAADGERWVAWTQGGFFDHADRGGKELVGLLLNRSRTQAPEWFTFAQVYRLLYAPDTVAARLRGETVALPTVSADDLRGLLTKAPPPDIELRALCWPAGGGEQCQQLAPSATSRGLHVKYADSADVVVPGDVQTITLRYRLAGATPGNSAVDLFVNGRNTGRVVRDVAPTPAADAEQPAPMDPGLNQVQLRAYDGGGLTYAQSRIIRVTRQAPAATTAKLVAPKPKLFILAVGIDHYPPTINSLNFAVADARAVAATIKAHAPSSYGDVEMTELYDQAASSTAVLKAMAAIGAQAAPEDTVIIYLSGHGVTLDKHYYFVTQNVDSVDAVPKAAISETGLISALAAIPARNGLLMLDTCHAGAFSLDSASQIAHESGRYVLAASASLEEALDSYDNRNGVFATAVLRALQGAALSNGKTIISNFDLGFFVTPLVKELASERHHHQSARFKIATEDAQPFPIVEMHANTGTAATPASLHTGGSP